MITQKKLLFCLFVISILWVGISTTSYAQSAQIQGSVIDGRNNAPVPGLTISLIHQNFGRSVPSTTDGFGRFVFFNIPIHSQPYFLEVYWGNRLMYRNRILVRGPVFLPPIIL